MREAILTKWLGQSSYIISFQSKLYPAIDQTAHCSFWRMEECFMKSVPWKREEGCCWYYNTNHCVTKNWKALTENILDAIKSSLKGLGKAQKKRDIARLRGSPLREILQYDLKRYCSLFDKVGLARHKNMKYWNRWKVISRR